MADIDRDLRCYLTNSGIAAENNAIQLGRVLKVTEMVFGDGLLADNKDPRLQTGMLNEVYSVPCAMLTDADNVTLLVFKGDIPADTGGFYINEVGIRLEDGTLYGYARGKGDWKPTLEQGATESLRYAVEMFTTNADIINVKVDLSSVYVDHEDLLAAVSQRLPIGAKAESAKIADTIGVTNLNRASSGVVNITGPEWFGAQPIGLSAMVQLNSPYLPVSSGSGYGYIFKINARDISGGNAWIFIDNIKPPSKIWFGVAHDTTAAPTWASVFSSANLPGINNVVGLSAALDGLSLALQEHKGELDPHHYYDSSRDYMRGEVISISDNGQLKQFFCNKPHTAVMAVNPIGDVLDTWREFPFKEVNNANGRALLYANGTCIQMGTNTHNQGTGKVEKIFPVPFTSTKSILASAFSDGSGATYLAGASFVGLSGYRISVNVYFSTEGVMYTNSTNNNPLISWVAFGRWAEDV
ncbi:phage tail protein [Photobacterium sp. WH24]|uniref:phage tail-collar fiber domain-containing protein n=1 Tax=Photobacterium sp. WH24 TaxID=2827237 RepID=UPI001C43D9D5|nr:phage tail protein [Photobacterium sp. WH24]MBV7264370.1 phage tail protein [Photobacterium sp. WH24]